VNEQRVTPPQQWLERGSRWRVGQVVGLLFLVGPIADLAGGSLSAVRTTAIVAALCLFVSLYLALVPPARFLTRKGERAVRTALLALAALAVIPLALGAPQSFVLLFAYVVAAAGVALPSWAAVAATCAVAAAGGLWLSTDGAPGATIASYVVAIVAVGWLMAAIGSLMRAYSGLRRAQSDLARLAVSEERVRIAGDLHDLLGHTLSVIALKSELAARLVETDPRKAQDELEEIQVVTRQALAEVREAVQGYRRLAVADALDGARAALTTAGIECRVESSIGALDADVEDVLAWTVREATTNVLRHSSASECAISIVGEPGRVVLRVEDDGAGAGDPSGGSAGLAGIARRADRLDGSLEAGPRPGGGFGLQLVLPLRSA
jgi:two-component system sensor histidine kinase DesK